MTVVSRIKILVDGRVALTTAMFAAETGQSVNTAGKTISRLDVEPLNVALDGRTPLYPAVTLRRAYRARPGRGAHLRKAAQAPAERASG